MSYIDRFRRRIADSAREDAPEYECRECNAGFEKRRQVCPECGSYSVRRREWGPIQ